MLLDGPLPLEIIITSLVLVQDILTPLDVIITSLAIVLDGIIALE